MVEQMADTTVATPGSTTDLNRPGAPKDRTCPFCNAPFTSSSLGRHLDLYIKEKNPKPPDDVHDVDEIRRLRGNVTRRQARTSSAKREGSTPSSSKPTPVRDQRSPSAPAYYPNINHVEGGPVRMSINKPGWQVTGVINNIPPSLTETPPAYAKTRIVSRRTSVKEDLSRKQDAVDERDRGRAAELALREILGSVRAATLRAHSRPPFDFNWFSQSFPAICLQCLSAPVSLLSAPMKPSEAAWPKEPPGLDQLVDLKTWLEARLSKWKQQREIPDTYRQQEPKGLNGHAAQQQPPEESSKEEAAYIKHLVETYNVWRVLPEKQKQDSWRLECQQAFTHEKEKHAETKSKLDRVEQELIQLRGQLGQRNDYRRPMDSAHFTPSTMPISRGMLQALEDKVNLSDWNYEATIQKWKTHIQNERSAQHPLPNRAPSTTWASNIDSRPRTNGTSSYLPTHANDMRIRRNNAQNTKQDHSDEDLADAPGDDDDDDDDDEVPVQNNTASEAVMDRRVIDPDLRDRPDTVMKGVDTDTRNVDGEGYVGGRVLVGLREFERGN